MSATTARVDGPETADAAPILSASEAGEAATGEGIASPAEKVVPADAGIPAMSVEEGEQQHRALAIARIRRSNAPAALKERMVGVAESADDFATVELCLKAVEESLPEFLRENRGESARPEHPAGEVFFRGTTEELTDSQAEEIAQRQLERSGLLRGQRVRMAG